MRQLVKAVAKGKQDAASELFDRYHPRLYRYALSKLANTADAEDVASETFSRVLPGLDKFKWSGGGFEPWLFRIAYNLVIDKVRDRERTFGDENPTLELPSLERGPAEAAIRSWEVSELMIAMASLPTDQREVLLLRFAADLDAAETGKVLERNANAVRQLQFRALTTLREKMTREVGP